MEVYEACVENVKRLKSQRRRLNQMVNREIKGGCNEIYLDAFKYSYAMLYSVFAEASFLKLLNTPYGFSEAELNNITSASSIEEQWRRCFEIAFKRIENETNKGDIANKKLYLTRILNDYVIAQIHIRNKIAHGQWAVCLNSKNTQENSELTKQIQDLDIVRIDRNFEIYMRFEQIVEDLIESPKKAFVQKFYLSYESLKQYIDDTKAYTLETKKKKLLESKKYLNRQ